MEGEFSTFVNELKWDLPDVPWEWNYNPPPPPPLGPNSPGALYARMDPVGSELVREKLLECFPRLTYVASMTAGSVSGVATSEDGLGYVPPPDAPVRIHLTPATETTLSELTVVRSFRSDLDPCTGPRGTPSRPPSSRRRASWTRTRSRRA